MDPSNRRDHYRIVYPDPERPRFVLSDSICEVLDCSERGLRFRPSAPEPLPPGTEIEGRLRFRRGGELLVRGAVVRTGDESVAVQLRGTGIPFAIVLEEQFYLRRVAR